VSHAPARGERSPGILVIGNENPEWPAIDKRYADEMWHMLLDGLVAQGIIIRAFKYFEDLSCLDAFEPGEWLVWNWGEEMAGRPWSEAEVAEDIERRGFTYTGSSPEVLRCTQSRSFVKERLCVAGLPTLPWRVCATASDAVGWSSFPAIVKGANQHASVGIDRESVVWTEAQLAQRIGELRRLFDDEALVEPFLDTREFQVAVWGNDTPEALPPSEIVFSTFTDPADRLHTREWKIERQSRGYREITMPCPAPHDRPDWRERIQEVALAAYQAFALRDYARFDMRMLGDEPQILDVNANPELDPESVVLAGAKAVGLDYGAMAARIATFAMARMPVR
jgi:D-alanine-D-alanine ligase